jgi:hypothetical protein
MPSNTTFNLLAIGIILIGVFLWRRNSPKLENEPNALPTLIPFFGHAFSFARNKRSFFQWAE